MDLLDCLKSNLYNLYKAWIWLFKKSLFDMTQHWEHMKQIKSTIQIPDEYKDVKIKVSCFDCEKESETEFCVDNFLECKHCNGFNVQKI
mgnify:CR=1 FL=1